MNKSVCVLLSTYNGEKYLRMQLESILAQKNVNVILCVRDDGSSDSTPNIIAEYANRTEVLFEKGENLGYAKSFWSLLQNAPEADYYAFCDQDDIWLSDKLISAINMLESENNSIPLLYTSNVVSVNDQGQVLSENCFNSHGILDVYRSFQINILPGCVFVFNSKSKELLSRYNGYMESHDWAVYAIVSVFGKVVYDSVSHIHYRIHGNNTIGVDSKFDYFIKKLKLFFVKNPCVRGRFAKEFYDCYGQYINDTQLARSVYLLGHYKDRLSNKMKLIGDSNFHGFIFKLYVLLNKV